MTLQEIMLSRIKETHVPAYRVSNRHTRPRACMSKTYAFADSTHMREFVMRLFELQDVTYHGAKITVEDNSVVVESYTRGVNDVTDLDHQFIELVDDAYDSTR